MYDDDVTGKIDPVSDERLPFLSCVGCSNPCKGMTDLLKSFYVNVLGVVGPHW